MHRRTFIQTTALAASGAMVLPGGLLARTGDAAAGSMWCYVWDLADEGYDAVLGRIAENGMRSISLACAYHAGKFLAPHNPKRKIVFPEDGTVYYTPTANRYGRITPLKNSLLREGHSLASVRREAGKRNLGVNAWVVCCHNFALGSRYPDIACRNAFGDAIIHNLCPSNDDVRAYLRAMTADLAAAGVHRIELEAMQFQGYSHGFHHEREGIPLSAAARMLLGWCFCPACERRARNEGVDLAAVRQFTRRTLEDLFEHPEPVNDRYKTLADLPADLMTPFLEWRQRVVASLAAELMEAAGTTGVALRPLVSIDPSARLTVGMNAAKVASITGGILTPGYVADGAALRGPLAELQRLVDGREMIVGMQVGLPESGGRQEFLSRMEAARAAGIHSFNFYAYGFIPRSHLTWIRESLL